MKRDRLDKREAAEPRVDSNKQSDEAGFGAHAHALLRSEEVTMVDGAHVHLFLLPDGTTILSEKDGAHSHKIHDEGAADFSDYDGRHVHIVKLEDGTELRTEADGDHSHQLQVSSSAFDGLHTHALALPGGQVITSLTPGEFWEHEGRPQASKVAASDSDVAKKIVLRDGEYCAVSEDGERSFGCYATRAEAVDRLREVEAFKSTTLGQAVEQAESFTLRAPYLYLDENGIHVDGDQIAEALESEITKALPDSVPLRFRKLEDGLTGNYIEFADLVVQIREAPVVKRLPYSLAPPVTKGSDPAIFGYAYQGKSFQASLLLPSSGWTFDIQNPDIIKADVPESLMGTIAKSFRMDGDRYARTMLHKVATTPGAAAKGGDLCVIDHVDVEYGLCGSGFREYFITKGDKLEGTLHIRMLPGGWKSWIGKTALPNVLRRGTPMPPTGLSGMPASLEKAVPDAYRFWEAEGDAREVRDALIDEAFFTEDNVRIVNGEYQRTVSKLYLYRADKGGSYKKPSKDRKRRQKIDAIIGARDATYVGADTFDDYDEAIEGAAAISKDGVLVVTADITDPSEVVDAVRCLTQDLVVGLKDSIPARDALRKLGVPMLVDGYPEHVWVSSFPVARPEQVTRLHKAEVATPTTRPEELDKKYVVGDQTQALLSGDRLVKALVPQDENGEERFALGIVLEPETIDAQNDIYSEEEVRGAAHKFMEDFRNMGLMHKSLVNDAVKILESYVAPTDLTIGDTTVKKGTWVIAVRVLDEKLWKAVKEGDLTGFSIGGSAIRVPESDVPPTNAD